MAVWSRPQDKNEERPIVTASQKVAPPEPPVTHFDVPGSRLTPSTRAAIRIVPPFLGHPLLVRYGAAVAMPFAALLLTMALESHLQNIIFVFFWPAVVGAAILGGFGPAAVASLTSVILTDVFLIAHSGRVGPSAPDDIVRFGAFLVTSLLVGTLAHSLQKERTRAAEAATQNARLAAKLDLRVADIHHKTALIDSGDADGLLYYVMPFVEGESLRDRLVRQKQLPLDDALRITREVADALSYAHARGVIHRDVKPGIAYRYAVSSVDRSGNESERSPAIEVTLP